MDRDETHMRQALRLARQGWGATSPNPMVGAVLARGGRVIGSGWHRRAGAAHAEAAAIADARRRGESLARATLYVTLEPCSTQGRTPPCASAIIAAGIRRVVAGATDPNPAHRGRGFRILRRAGVAVETGVLAEACEELNEVFNHWITTRLPFVTVKAAMTLDGKIATAHGESKWITGEAARQAGMRLRRGADAILAGVNTILADDPSLTCRTATGRPAGKRLRRVVLDRQARTPVSARVVADADAAGTTIVVAEEAPARRVRALSERVRVWRAPAGREGIDVGWLLRRLGAEDVTSLLVEGGGEVNASFLLGGHAQRVAFFYAPLILGGREARKAVAGEGAARAEEIRSLREIRWRRLGPDWLMTARVA